MNPNIQDQLKQKVKRASKEQEEIFFKKNPLYDSDYRDGIVYINEAKVGRDRAEDLYKIELLHGLKDFLPAVHKELFDAANADPELMNLKKESYNYASSSERGEFQEERLIDEWWRFSKFDQVLMDYFHPEITKFDPKQNFLFGTTFDEKAKTYKNKTSSSIATDAIYAAMPTIDRKVMEDAFNTIAGFETNNQSINQIGGSKRGQGIFQFEKGKAFGAHTGLGRLINVLSNDGLPDFVNPVQLDDNVKQELIVKAKSLLAMEDPDLSKESRDFQNLLMLTDKIFHRGWSMQGVSDGTVNYFDAYIQGHWAGSDPKDVETYKKRWREEGHKMFYGKMKGGFIDMEDGGEVGIPPGADLDPTQPSLTSKVLPNETVQPTGFVDNTPSVDTVDTEQGFYADNPAPGESIEEFERRTRKYTTLEHKLELKDTSSFRPPEDYVSPRISNTMGYSGDGDSSILDDLALNNVTFPDDVDNNLVNALTVIGTAGDVMAGQNAKQDAAPGFTAKYWADSFNDFNPDITLDLPGILDPQELELSPRASTWLAETNEARAANGIAPLTGQHAEQFISLMDTIDSIASMDPATLTREMGNITVGTTTVNVFDVPGAIAGVDGLNVDVIKQALGDPLKVYGAPMAEDVTFATNADGSIDYTKTVSGKDLTTSAFDNIKNTIEEIGNTHLFSMQDGKYEIALKDLYDEMAAGILTGLVTGDGEKALIASGAQFVKSEVVESYAVKAANLVGGIDTVEGKAIYKKWRGYGGAATTMAATLALGGDEEAALTAGVQHLVTELGAKTVGEMFGTKAAETLGAEALGGATIAAVVGFIRTGDLEQAAISGVSSYLFSVNPILGMAAMALQFIMAKEPSFESGYASFDFDNFELNSYSQGDYDSDKANPDNVEFSKQLTEPLIPYLQELEKTTGFDFKGDLQIHYSGNKKGAGIYYTIGNRDQEGLDAEGMFLNRLDYYDGKDQSTQDGGKVYRRHFQATDKGLEAMYEALYADLAYIAENNITDLTHYTGVVKTLEQVQTEIAESGYNTNNINFMQDGGKILDKSSKVLYNSNQAKNYGLVDKKGKAPPSMRADDVPMTLKEGDFVLSQPAVALYGEDTIQRMVNRASKEAGTNLKSGGKVPVNVHNGEYIIPKNLTKYIGSNVLENMNNRGLMSVGDKTNI
tara:strand:- start:11875 stop:15369 length:3495 start_codon:yes stop_codon:yes gene_type:complete